MEALLKETFRDRRVLVTGHTGFKGSWLCLWLKELGAEVIGFGLAPYTPHDNFVRCGLAGKMIDTRGDVRDYPRLQAVFQEYHPEFVFHLAAQPLVREGFRNPKETYDTNVGGTVNVLENCRETASVKIVVNVTSDKCYENKEWIWGYRENDPLGGDDPYSSSKGCAELVTAAYRKSFFDPADIEGQGKSLSSVRAGNVIGGGDWRPDRLIPDCIRALEKGEAIPIRNPRSVRPWQWVLEPLGGYLLLAAKMWRDPGTFCGAWNFGPPPAAAVRVRDLVEEVTAAYGGGKWSLEGEAEELPETRLLALDSRKAMGLLGWQPSGDIGEAVKHTVAWYKNYREKTDMYKFCRGQVWEYREGMGKIREDR